MASAAAKEVLLINPCLSNRLFNLLQSRAIKNIVPYSLLTLAALTPKDYKVGIVNQRRFWGPGDFGAGRLVGITCLTSAVFEAYRLADRFRGAGSRVVLGGPHASALPEEALEHADSVVIGEAESVWGRVLRDFEDGRLEKTYKGEPLEDFFSSVYEYFLRLDASVLRDAGIRVDRGCRYHCDFCARLSGDLRFVRTKQVLELVKRIKSAGRPFFMRRPLVKIESDNIYSSPAYAKKLFQEMIPLEVSWVGNATLDIGLDEEALRLARASGCRELLVGFESIYPGDHKKTSLGQVRSAGDYRAVIRNIRRHGIRVTGSFILGLDSYRHPDYLRLLGFLMRAGLWFSILAILTPFPGSALFERLKKENRILSFDWRKYVSFICVIKPKHTSAAGLYFWFWSLRLLSVFFSPMFLLPWVVGFLSWEAGYRIVSWFLARPF